jgi:phage baseplate assembly protein W
MDSVLAWWNNRVESHRTALPERLPQYRALDLSGKRSEITNAAVIRQSFGVILRTRPGDVPQRLTFGSRLPELIDQPRTVEVRLAVERESVEALRQWEPRVEIMSATVINFAAQGLIELMIKWRPIGGNFIPTQSNVLI